MPALAITDHGVLSGIIQFYQQCRKAGIKPIIGLEAYVVEDRFRKEGQNEERWHLTLLARDNTGYRNLLKLGSLAFLEGYYYKPRMDYRCSQSTPRASSACPAAPAAGSPRLCRTGRSRRPTPRWSGLLDIFGREQRLPGDAGDRHRRAGRDQPAHGRAGGPDRAQAGGHQRRALPARERRHARTTCCSASRPGRACRKRTACASRPQEFFFKSEEEMLDGLRATIPRRSPTPWRWPSAATSRSSSTRCSSRPSRSPRATTRPPTCASSARWGWSAATATR